jgi:hypothetical protein
MVIVIITFVALTAGIIGIGIGLGLDLLGVYPAIATRQAPTLLREQADAYMQDHCLYYQMSGQECTFELVSYDAHPKGGGVFVYRARGTSRGGGPVDIQIPVDVAPNGAILP